MKKMGLDLLLEQVQLYINSDKIKVLLCHGEARDYYMLSCGTTGMVRDSNIKHIIEK